MITEAPPGPFNVRFNNTYLPPPCIASSPVFFQPLTHPRAGDAMKEARIALFALYHLPRPNSLQAVPKAITPNCSSQSESQRSCQDKYPQRIIWKGSPRSIAGGRADNCSQNELEQSVNPIFLIVGHSPENIKLLANVPGDLSLLAFGFFLPAKRS